jgi:signal transduction histidine kinase/ABC-type amino acid transport substrate-binding protein/ActR/RegA family two-component response regulator
VAAVLTAPAATRAQAPEATPPATAVTPRPFSYGGNANFPPYEYLDARQQPAGFNIALIRALAREAGVPVSIRLGRWRETLDALERGDIDLVTMAVTDERALRFDLLIQTWTLQHSVVFRAGRTSYPRGLEDLAAESIATEPRALMDELLRKLPETRRPVVLPADNQVHALRMLVDGQASGAAGNSLALRYTARGLGVRDLVEVPVKSFAYRLTAQKGREQEFAWMEPAIGRLRATGQFERLVEQHLVLPATRETGPLGRYLLAISAGVGLLWLGTVAWTRALRRQVRRQTVALQRSLDDRESMARLLQGLLEGTAKVTGEAFFPSLVRHLGQSLGVRQVIVGEIVELARPRVRTIAVWRDNALAENIEFDLADTPVALAVRDGFFCCETGLAARFPASACVQSNGTDSIAAARLVDASGRVIGVLAVMDGRPLDAPERAGNAVRIFAGRAAAELERQQAEAALAGTTEMLATIGRIQSRFIAQESEHGPFDEMLAELLALTGSRCGFISEVVADPRTGPRFVTLASRDPEGVSLLPAGGDRDAGTPGVREIASLVGKAVSSAAPVIASDLASRSAEHANGASEAPICASFMALPVSSGGAVIGVIGAGDRAGGYDEELAHSLQPFLATCGLLIEAFRANARRRAAEDDRRQLEAQVQHAQKLESLGVLAGGIAHDFNNLLVGVLGHAELARAEVAPDSTLASRLTHIETAALRASELTNQMLAYSGKGKFLVSAIDLTRLVREMAQLLDVSISKKATLRYEFAAATPSIDGDQAQIRQVVMNLLTNASEAIGDREGTITIRIGTMAVDAQYVSSIVGAVPEAGTYVFLEVADTGCGMDAETASRIFDPFFTTKFTGRGLGLAATLGIVRGHGGGVRIRTAPDQGSTFTVVLPIGRLRPQAAPEPQPPAPAGARSGLVLVVDDEPTVLAVATTALERAGLSVVTASDGREALDVIAASGGAIEAAVIDLTMPIMGGDEVIARLRDLRPDLGVLLSSGYAEPDIARTLGARYDCGFIQKPYRSTALVESVSALLTRARQAKPAESR